MKVLFLTNIPSPYRVSFFNELGKLCDLTVYFEKQSSDERNDSWKEYRFENFRGVFLKGKSISTDTAICPEITKRLKRENFDKIIIGNFSSPTGMMAIRYLRRRKIQYYLEADGGTAKNGKGLKEKLKKHFIKGAAGYFSTSASCDRYFITYGADVEKLYRYPFTSLHDKDILKHPPTKEEKKKLRDEMGLKEEKILISVGRFSYLSGYGKGYDTLLKICEQLPKNIGVYIIGDEPTEEFVNWKEEKRLDNLYYLPFKRKDELFKYYQAADLSVFLSRGEAWGLVVNESMANGLPVITTYACVAGLELIEHEKNGYIVPVDSVETTRDIIMSFFNDEKTQQEMAESALKTIISYTIENMAQSHIVCLNEAITNRY